MTTLYTSSTLSEQSSYFSAAAQSSQCIGAYCGVQALNPHYTSLSGHFRSAKQRSAQSGLLAKLSNVFALVVFCLAIPVFYNLAVLAGL